MSYMNYLNESAAQVGQGLEAEERARREQIARSRGFPSYEAMILYERQKSRKRTDQTAQSSPTWDSMLEDAQALHPKRIFEYVTGKIRDATGSGQ